MLTPKRTIQFYLPINSSLFAIVFYWKNLLDDAPTHERRIGAGSTFKTSLNEGRNQKCPAHKRERGSVAEIHLRDYSAFGVGCRYAVGNARKVCY